MEQPASDVSFDQVNIVNELNARALRIDRAQAEIFPKIFQTRRQFVISGFKAPVWGSRKFSTDFLFSERARTNAIANHGTAVVAANEKGDAPGSPNQINSKTTESNSKPTEQQEVIEPLP